MEAQHNPSYVDVQINELLQFKMRHPDIVKKTLVFLFVDDEFERSAISYHHYKKRQREMSRHKRIDKLNKIIIQNQNKIDGIRQQIEDEKTEVLQNDYTSDQYYVLSRDELSAATKHNNELIEEITRKMVDMRAKEDEMAKTKKQLEEQYKDIIRNREIFENGRVVSKMLSRRTEEKIIALKSELSSMIENNNTLNISLEEEKKNISLLKREVKEQVKRIADSLMSLMPDVKMNVRLDDLIESFNDVTAILRVLTNRFTKLQMIKVNQKMK
jgi:hypothetical protein